MNLPMGRIFILVMGTLFFIGCAKHALYQPLKKVRGIGGVNGDTLSCNLSATDRRIETDKARLESYSAALDEMIAEMGSLRKGSEVYSNDYFEPREHDKIEGLLFRYILCRRALWEMVRYHVKFQDRFSDPVVQTKSFLVGFSAGLHVSYTTSLAVETFLKETTGKAKLNEAYPKSGIPAGTYDTLFQQITSLSNIKTLRMAWVLFNDELADSLSPLSLLTRQDSSYRRLVEDIQRRYTATQERTETILKESTLFLPEFSNQIRHSVIHDLAGGVKNAVGNNLSAMRNILFTAAGDFKSPTVNPLSFTEEQKRKVKALLEPGDILLTFSAGYMSNVFLPGRFKHGIAFVGNKEARQRVGFTEASVSLMEKTGKELALKHMSKERLENGNDVDVIEAVSEGVILNSVDNLMEDHFNRMVVLRPKLSSEERVAALVDAFSFTGCKYDFKFDFNDGSAQCCTEILYRMFNLRGGYKFNLVRRAGAFTLSADDIVDYYLKNNPTPFEFVLFAEEGESSEGRTPALYAGVSGEERFRAFATGKTE